MTDPRNNPTQRIDRRGRVAAGGGFTLIELMISVTVFSVLLAVAGAVFNTVRETVGLGTAQAEVMNYVRSLEVNLRRDLQQIPRDGFLVVKSSRRSYEGQWVATDQMIFPVIGKATSAQTEYMTTMDGRAYGWGSRIWYGTMAGDSTGADYVGEPHRGTLGRQAVIYGPADQWVIQPMQSSASWWGDGNMTQPDPAIIGGGSDLIQTTDLAIRGYVLDSPDRNVRRQRLAAACGRTYGKSFVDMSSRGQPVMTFAELQAQITLTQSAIVPNCSSFQVEFAGDFDGNGEIDTVNGNVRWYGLKDPTGRSDIDLETTTDNYTAVFDYDRGTTPLPRLLKFTVFFHDAAGRFHRNFLRNSSPFDGKCYTFIVYMPVHEPASR